jgi:proline dehydrogenase
MQTDKQEGSETRVLSRIKSGFIRRVVSSHLAGPVVADAVRFHQQVLGFGWTSTFGYWGGPDDTPASTARAYHDAIVAVRNGKLASYLSIKLPGLEFDTELLRSVLDEAKESGIRIHLDSLAPEDADRTYAILDKFVPLYENLSSTLAARWLRTVTDADRIVDYGIPVRIVKGQWSDPSAPKLDARKNYLAVVDRLAGRAKHVAIATHEPSLAAEALRRLKGSSTSCEMEQMSSLPQNCAGVARQLSVPMRIYIPYGFPSLPYSLRHAPARPAIVGWVIRDFILGGSKKLTPS